MLLDIIKSNVLITEIRYEVKIDVNNKEAYIIVYQKQLQYTFTHFFAIMVEKEGCWYG
jgi:hypothetical protein